MRELPLLVASESGGRSPLSFIFLDSSVVSNDRTGTGATSGSTGTNATNFRINGGQGLGADILIDGAQTRRGENGTFFSEVAPGPNAFQEFTLSTSSYSAEFGNSSGGVVNFTIKTGSNDFHGEAYLFHINDALNANIDRNRILNTRSGCTEGVNCLEKPLDRQFDYGFSVGGPLYLPRFGEGGAINLERKEQDVLLLQLRRLSHFSVAVGGRDRSDRENAQRRFWGTADRPLQCFSSSAGPSRSSIRPQARGGAYSHPWQPFGSVPWRLAYLPIGRNFVNLFPLPNQTGAERLGGVPQLIALRPTRPPRRIIT